MYERYQLISSTQSPHSPHHTQPTHQTPALIPEGNKGACKGGHTLIEILIWLLYIQTVYRSPSPPLLTNTDMWQYPLPSHTHRHVAIPPPPPSHTHRWKYRGYPEGNTEVMSVVQSTLIKIIIAHLTAVSKKGYRVIV